MEKRTDLNGIDFLEVNPLDHRILTVKFFQNVPPKNPADPSDPDDQYGLSQDLSKITITGGTRVVGIQPIAAKRNPDGTLTITVDQPGDYSTYTLALQVGIFDPLYSQIDFSFMATCAVDFDCRTTETGTPPVLNQLLLDYEARDYSSFRRMLLDLLPQLNPNFVETNPSDLGMALLELLAYAGDRFAYFQDAVANEAYLDTLRQRISARRMAKLIDYCMHDGRNAWAHVHVAVNQPVILSLGTKVLSRITRPLSGDVAPPGAVVPGAKINADATQSDPALNSVVIFETAFGAQLDPRNNQILIHTWGNEECCLPAGVSEAFLFTLDSTGSTAILPVLHKGDYLLIEEVMGPETGAPADADPLHRQVVRIDEEPEPTSDLLFNNVINNGAPEEWKTGDTVLPLLRVHWRAPDELAQPFCLSVRSNDGKLIRNISVARGNMVLADHGLTTSEFIPLAGPVPENDLFRPKLTHSPLTMEIEPPLVQYDPLSGRVITPRTDLAGDVRQAQPAIALLVDFPTGKELWTPAEDLLESSPFDTFFVPEVNNTETAVLRFGDDEYGRSIAGATSIQATYRFGNGAAGNVGADSLAHVAPDALLTGITRVRNPLAARGGVDPETIAEVRQWAPEAFRAIQFRAVTEADYANAARILPQVQSAVASFRWTGSWHTVFIGILPANPGDLVTAPDGVTALAPSLQRTVLNFLDSYRIAGYDLEIRPPEFLALEVDLLVCAAPDHFRGDVEQAVKDALSNRRLADGSKGFFFPGNFVFGQPLYLSRIYAATAAVEGVDSVVVTAFHVFGQAENGELVNGVIPVGPWQIARLNNDPSFMEHGVLKITMRGGKL
jgi:hypothetical protein